jgi:hypothetical protein
MANEQPLLPEKRQIPTVSRETKPAPGATVLSTRDHELIREWARDVAAEPATAEQTPSGPAPAMTVVDGGTALRFNFPGVSPFRGISWTEWFDHFTSHDFTFVYDNAQPGHPPSARYQIVPAIELANG